MKLSPEERDAIVSYRKQKAHETLKEAEGIASLGFWNAVANRLYYACYYMTSALLIHYGYTARSHAGVIRLLGLHFVTTGYIAQRHAKFYTRLFELRQSGDYDDFYNITEDDIKPLIEPARNYIETVRNLIEAPE